MASTEPPAEPSVAIAATATEENKTKDTNERQRKDRGHHRRGERRTGPNKWRVGAKKNVKTRYDDRPESSNADDIRRQVEFYFSNSNLPADKHLLTLTGGVENKPVPLKEIHAFKRMRNFQPYSAVLEALKHSEHLKVDEGDGIFRKVPLPGHFTMSVEENRKLLETDSEKRSIYAKGFGEEGEKTGFEIEKFFEPYGTNSVRLRRHDNGFFKGSVFVEFETESIAQDFLNLKIKPKYNGEELEYKSKTVYINEKKEAIREGKVQPKESRFNDRHASRNGPKRRRDRDDDREDWRTRRDRDQKRIKSHHGNDEEKNDNEGGDAEDVSKKPAATEPAETAPAADEIKPAATEPAEAVPAATKVKASETSAGADVTPGGDKASDTTADPDTTAPVANAEVSAESNADANANAET